jgi:Tetratricopeptide repeat
MRPVLRAVVVLWVLTAGGVAGVATSPALAQGTKAGSPGRAAAVQRAKESFQQGQKLFTVSRYREALEQFKNAFLAVEDPVFLFNIAQCHRLLGEKEEAARFYRRYLEAAPSNASERARAEKWIAELEAGQSVPTPVAAAAPPPAPPPLMGSTPNLEPPPVAGDPAPGINLTAPPPADTEPRPIYKKWWFWAGVGAVVVVGGIAAAAAASGGGVTCGGGVQKCEQL